MATGIRSIDRGGPTLTEDEARALLEACSSTSATGLRNRALFIAFYRGGLRVGEALSLEIDAIDTGARSLRVTSGGRVRTIDLDSASFRYLQAWIERRDRLPIARSTLVFCTLHGRPLSASYVRGFLRRLAERCGIDKRVSTTLLRRTLAVELAREGFPLATIQKQLGHASIETTLRSLEPSTTTASDVAPPRRREWID